MTTRRRAAGLGAAGVALAAGGRVALAYRAALKEARDRTSGALSTVIPTPFGGLEYAIGGHGRPVLMIHGAGGGFDQGLFFAAPLMRAGFKVIAPSRFGYLRSDLPADPSPENRADAFAALLDRLKIDRVPVVVGSAGALSATAFAIRHRDRCAALAAIVPLGYAPGAPAAPFTPMQQRLANAALRSDVLFWTMLKTRPDALMRTLLATEPEVVRAAPASEQARVREILHRILPVSQRRRGLANDMRLAAAIQPQDLAAIRAPVLAVSFADDRYGTLEAAQHLAASAPGARLAAFPSGGHVWAGHDEEMFGLIAGFLRETAEKGDVRDDAARAETA